MTGYGVYKPSMVVLVTVYHWAYHIKWIYMGISSKSFEASTVQMFFATTGQWFTMVKLQPLQTHSLALS